MVRFAAPSNSQATAPPANFQTPQPPAPSRPSFSLKFTSPTRESASDVDFSLTPSANLSFSGAEAGALKEFSVVGNSPGQPEDANDTLDLSEDRNQTLGSAESNRSGRFSLPRALGLDGNRLHLMARALHGDSSPLPGEFQGSAQKRKTPLRENTTNMQIQAQSAEYYERAAFPVGPTALPIEIDDSPAFSPFDRTAHLNSINEFSYSATISRERGQFRSFGACFGPGGLIAFTHRETGIALVNLVVDEDDEEIRQALVENSLNVHMQIHSEEQTPAIREVCDFYSQSLNSLLPDSRTQAEFFLHCSSSSALDSHSFSFSIFSQIQHSLSVFQLVKALFAEEFGSRQGNSVVSSAYGESSARAFALSKWLENAVSREVAEELRNIGGDSPIAAIRALLSGHQKIAAVDRAVQSGNFRLAALIAQAGENDEFADDFRDQLLVWQNNGTWDTLSLEFRQVYTMLAGDAHVQPDLSWLRGLGSQLWFGAPCGNQTIAFALSAFQEAFKHKLASAPLPPYPVYRPYGDELPKGRGIDDDENMPGEQEKHEESEESPRDTRFELLAVYSGLSHNYSALFSPASSSPFPLDFSLSFHLFEILRLTALPSFPRVHWLYDSFIQQLEIMGLWHWGVYVALHTERVERTVEPGMGKFLWNREIIVKEILNRRITYTERGNQERVIVHNGLEAVEVFVNEVSDIDCEALDDQIDEKLAAQGAIEEFLIERVRVPTAWISEAKALAALNDFKFSTAIKHFIDAGNFADAHNIAVERILPALFVAGKHGEVENLLKQLAGHAKSIPQWSNGGEFYQTYYKLIADADSVLPISEALSHDEFARCLSLKESLMEFCQRADHKAAAINMGKEIDQLAVVDRAVIQLMNSAALQRIRGLELQKRSTDAMVDSSMADRAARVALTNFRLPLCVSNKERRAALDNITQQLLQRIDA